MKTNTILQNSKIRNSGIELLRIIFIFSIVLSHTLGADKSLTGINGYLTVLCNSTLHAGVGVAGFMLITGYFGAHLSQKRFNKVYSIIFICSILTLAIAIITKEPLSLIDKAKHLVPVMTKQWWYASCYIYTLLLSPFLDKIADMLDKKTYKTMLLVSIGLFYVLPTFLYFDIMSDKGKGLANMIVAYFIGRYMSKYKIDIKTKHLVLVLIGSMAVSFVGNAAATFARKAISWPFSRDCSVFTLITAIALIMLFSKLEFKSKPINYFASKTFYMYLLPINALIAQFVINPMDYANSPVFILIALLITIVSLLISFVVSIILGYPAKIIEIILNFAENTICKFYNKALNIYNSKRGI